MKQCGKIRWREREEVRKERDCDKEKKRGREGDKESQAVRKRD